jgi:hypothetical protein
MQMQRVARRAGVGTLAMAVAAGLALGLAGPPAPSADAAYSKPVAEGPAPCYWGGQPYSHGASIEVVSADGTTVRTYDCNNGTWVFRSSSPRR